MTPKSFSRALGAGNQRKNKHMTESRSKRFSCILVIPGAGALRRRKQQTTKAYDIRIMIWLAAEGKPHDLCDKPQRTTQLENLEKGETFQHRSGCQNNSNNHAEFQHKKKKNKMNEIFFTFMNSKTNRC